jgi:hypothetical protein
MLRLREKALKGDSRALETVLNLARTHNSDEGSDRLADESLAAEDQAILEAFAEEIRSRPAAEVESTPDTPQREEGEGDA